MEITKLPPVGFGSLTRNQKSSVSLVTTSQKPSFKKFTRFVHFRLYFGPVQWCGCLWDTRLTWAWLFDKVKVNGCSCIIEYGLVRFESPMGFVFVFIFISLSGTFLLRYGNGSIYTPLVCPHMYICSPLLLHSREDLMNFWTARNGSLIMGMKSVLSL